MHRSGPRTHWAWWLLAIALVVGWQAWPRLGPGAPASRQPLPAEPSGEPGPAAPAIGPEAALPPEALRTIALISRGGPFPYAQDGSTFGNREGHLPRQPRGWYREYTVDTPGLDHRGARRIVTGGDPPSEWYYTDDHYDSFRRVDPAPSRSSPP